MIMKNKTIISFMIVLAMFLISLYFYQFLPDTIITHWDSQGQANGYMAKFWGLFLVPIISLAILLLFLAIPKIDPLKKNIKKFENYYYGFIIIFLLFFLYIHIITILANLGYMFNMMIIIIPAISILFYYLGILMKKSKRNWFIGIRTPWTLSSDKIWHKTHQLGSVLFKISAIISLFGIFFPIYAIWFILIPILIASIYLVVYSYILFRKLKR